MGKEDARVKGPCVVCDREMQYAAGWPADEAQARKQFKPKRREKIVKKLRTGEWDGRVPHLETIEKMVCAECLSKCAALREERSLQQQAERQARQQRVELRRNAVFRHYEWRTVTASEIDRTPHSAEFRASLPNDEMHRILFRWRAVPGKCRGESYNMAVGMWVDGVLTAHYYGWNLQSLSDDDYRMFYASEDKWDTSDLFGRGFCRWVERAFQQRLLRLEPDQSWRPGQADELNVSLGRPGMLRIVWLDGTQYVHLLPSLDLPAVVEWAEQNLGMRIEESAFVPVKHPRSAILSSCAPE
jgi:hypothetical protein